MNDIDNNEIHNSRFILTLKRIFGFESDISRTAQDSKMHNNKKLPQNIKIRNKNTHKNINDI